MPIRNMPTGHLPILIADVRNIDYLIHLKWIQPTAEENLHQKTTLRCKILTISAIAGRILLKFLLTTSDERWITMIDDLQQKMTSNTKRPPMAGDLQWKVISNGRWPTMEEDLQWKTTSNERQPSMEDKLQWKITSNGKGPPMKDMENELKY